MNARTILALTSVGSVLILASLRTTRVPYVVYNASDSAPRGWYRVIPSNHLQLGDYVVARLPDSVAGLASARGYLPPSVPVLKRVAALAGQRACIRNKEVEIDGRAVARTLDVDARGRPLVAWRECRRLVEGELFLLNTAASASFDSRYYGPIDVSFVRGVAIPLRGAASQ